MANGGNEVAFEELVQRNARTGYHGDVDACLALSYQRPSVPELIETGLTFRPSDSPLRVGTRSLVRSSLAANGHRRMQPFQPRECLPITGAFGEHVVPQPLNVDMVTALGGVDDDGLATGTVRAGIAGAADDVRRRLLTKAQRPSDTLPLAPVGRGCPQGG